MQQYSNSLFRQFPNSVSGNAAIGVSISVYERGTTNLVTLYANDDVGGATLPNPLTTNNIGFYSFYAPDGKYTLHFGSSQFPDLNIQLIDALNLVDAFNTAIDATGYILVDNAFSGGYTVTQRNEALLYDGVYYVWKGALPKVITAGSSVASTGGIGNGAWQAVLDNTLEQRLEAGTAPIGSVTADEVSDLVEGIADGSALIAGETAQRVADLVPLTKTYDNNWASRDSLLIWCGDSTTEQMGTGSSGFDWMTSVHRVAGQRLADVAGLINFGGSGYRLDLFVNDAAATPPTIPTGVNAGLGSWDYYGHKPTGAISLATALAWRTGKADVVVWTICYGINDCILNADVGTLSQSEIADYISSRLVTAVGRIWAEFPQDKIVLRVPNPMTARPFNPASGFPSATVYPDFGDDDAADQALVQKWNLALYQAYYDARNIVPAVRMLDTWLDVFGGSTTTLLAGTQIPFLVDLVHPDSDGYRATVDAYVNVVNPVPASSAGRRKEAEQRAALIGGDPWDYYNLYLADNPAYSLKAEIPRLLNGGATFLDLDITQAKFNALIDTTKPIWIRCGNATQLFISYTPADASGTTRLLGISPSAALQGARGNAEVYQQIINQPSTDAYIAATLASSRPRNQYPVAISAGGNGYFDIRIEQTTGRPSSKFLTGIRNGDLIIGGGINTTLSLTGKTISRNGAASARSIRVLLAGDYTSYAGKPAFLTFSDLVSNPAAFEYLPPIMGSAPHQAGCRVFINCPIQMLDGGTMSIRLTEEIASDVTLNIYRLRYNTRTLIGTITVPANNGSANMSSGNPTSVNAYDVFEAELTSATSQATGIIIFILNPA